MRSRPASVSAASSTALLRALHDAGDIAEVEALIAAEVEALPRIDSRWAILSPLFPPPREDLDAAVQRDLSWALSTAGPRVDPLRVRAGGGLVAVFPCGADTSHLLVVGHAGRVGPGVDGELARLAGFAGFAIARLTMRAEIERQRSVSRFEELVRYSSDAIFITDTNGRIMYAAPSVTTVLGYRSTGFEGVDLGEFLADNGSGALRRFLAEVARRGPRQPAATELRFVRADGRTIETDVVGANLLQSQDVGGLVLTLRDVTARRDLEAQLRHQAFHDALTGLANRALFLDRLEQSLRVRRDLGHPHPAVVFLDLDDFKDVNDTLGHQVGDLLLRTFAERITGCLRGGDTAARLGGDEFALIIDAPADETEVQAIVDRVLSSVRTPIELEDGTKLSVRASAGAVMAGPETATAGDLLRCADLAMYRAKVQGKGHVRFYESGMQLAARDRLALSAELDAAIDFGDIDVHFQPVVDLTSGETVGVEALARWPHAERGLLDATDFMPVAEESGLVVPLGVAVLRRALDRFAAWSPAHPGAFLSINVSPQQLGSSFEAMLFELLAEFGIAPGRIVLEVTERVGGADRAVVEVCLRRLVDRGVRLAVEDLGTGNVSLRHLHDVPFAQLKISREFVAELATERGRSVTRMVVALARSLGADVVAVGIENGDEQAELRSMGCRYGQGWHLGAPAVPDSGLTSQP